MATLTQLVDEVLLYLQGFGLAQSRATFLTSAVTDADLVWFIDDADPVQEGLAEIDDELIYVRSFDPDNLTLTVSPDGRGWRGTTAAAHDIADRVTVSPTFPRIAVANAINDTIESVYPTLFGVAAVNIIWNVTDDSYALPAEAERVLSVVTDTGEPSKDWPEVHSWSFSSIADTTEFPTTNTITIYEGLYPGREFRVTYAKKPTRLTASDDLTVSGLSSSAKLCIVYGACAQLVGFLDPARLGVSAVESDALDQQKPVGRGVQVSQSLQARHLQELAGEQRRQRQAYPPKLHRTR